MPSKTKEARLEQKQYFEKKLAERLTLLGEKGLEPRQITRDAGVKKLRAQIRKTNDRLKVIEGLEQRSEEMLRSKEEKAAAPKKKEKASKKKSQEEEAQMSKRQQKKRAKKEEKEVQTTEEA